MYAPLYSCAESCTIVCVLEDGTAMFADYSNRSYVFPLRSPTYVPRILDHASSQRGRKERAHQNLPSKSRRHGALAPLVLALLPGCGRAQERGLALCRVDAGRRCAGRRHCQHGWRRRADPRPLRGHRLCHPCAGRLAPHLVVPLAGDRAGAGGAQHRGPSPRR